MISSAQKPLLDTTQQTDMPPVGFELPISTGERLQTYALDRAVTGTGQASVYTNLKNVNTLAEFFIIK